MALYFDRDPRKAANSARKHGITFDEAATVFGDPLSLTVPDLEHSEHGEDRFVTMGRSHQDRLLVVVHAEYDDVIRIVSARTATQRERRAYEEGE